MQIPNAHTKEDALACNNGNCPRDGNARVGWGAVRRQLPHACNRQRGYHVLHNGHEDKNPRNARQDQIDEHEKLAQPAQDPVALEVVDESEQGGDVGSGRQ